MGYTGPNNIDSLQKWIIEQSKTNPEVEKELTSYLQSVPTTNKGKRLYGSKKASDLTKDQLYNQFNDKLWGYRFPKLQSLLPQYEGQIPLVDISGPWDKEDEETATTSTGDTKNVVANKTPWWAPYANQAIDYLRPSDQEAFDYAQVYPEMALAMNQAAPVQAQLYHPDLGTPMDISLQDQMNANQSDFNAIQRQVGYNPAALSVLASQKYKANSGVLGEQFRLNQAEKQRVYEENRSLLNQAQLQNLGILDQQMQRQETAKSKTKEQALEAMKSISDKIAKNKLENRQLGIYENLYKYRFDKNGKAMNMNPLAFFDVAADSAKASSASAPEGYEYETILKKKKKKDEDTGRNGKIVKAIKNL
jgi:hypothetical protein